MKDEYMSEEELVIYAELGDFFDRHMRSFLHSREHINLTRRIALALALLESQDERSKQHDLV